MQPILKNKRMLLSASLLLAMSNASMATTETYSITARTIQDVQITQEQALAFGQTILGTAGSTCTMSGLAPGDADLQSDINGDGTADAGTNFGDLTGTGCLNGQITGTVPGIYLLSGEPGAAISITVGTATEAEYTFAAGNGCAVAYDGTAAADACGFVGNNVAQSRKLPLATAAEQPAGPANPAVVAGESRLTLGWTLTIGAADLTAGDSFSSTFDITVTYE